MLPARAQVMERSKNRGTGAGGRSSTMDRRRVTRAFKMRGLSIQSPALDAMMNVLQRDPSEEILHAVLDEIKERNMSSPDPSLVVTKQLLSNVVADMSRDGGDVTDEALQLLNAFDTPRLRFDTMRRQFNLLSKDMEPKGRSLHGEAIHKVDMFQQRYALIQQRILRQDLFRPKLVTADGRHADGQTNVTHAITPVESMLGRSGVKFLLGMIVQVEEGRYYLEDHTAQVPMDLSHASVLTDGFITENCIVLVEGEMVDGVLQVHRMGNPIIESRLDAMDNIGLLNSDIFGSMSSLSELEKLREQEFQHGPEGMFVILSDVHLDRPVVMEKLERLFEGFQDMSPLPIFVFMGNFTSKPLSAARDGTKSVIAYYEELANLICKFPTIANEGRFVFVPGPNDPGLGNVLPRPPIPNYFTGALRSKLKHAIFASNPCRIRFFTKELVFCRQDIIGKLRQECLTPSFAEETAGGIGHSNNDRLVQHTVKTILDQSHLCPLSLSSSPIYWQYDHALRLYPLPDAVIMGDRMEQYYQNYAECDAINPGPFSSDFNFVVYRPVAEVERDVQTRSDVEFSQIS